MPDVVVERFAGPAFALLRIMAGLMFALHGSQILFGVPAMDMKGPMPTIVVVAGWIELICGALITIGLFGRYAAFIASGLMAVAYFMAHFPHGLIPLQNKGELAVLYCFVWLYTAAHGSGIWSVDSILSRRTPAVSASTGAGPA